MDLQTVFILVIVGACVAIWAHHSKISHIAISAAQHVCQQQQLQLLDQSAVLEKINLSTYRGMPCLVRRFRFEFSRGGERRYCGWITLRAWQVQDIELQPFADKILH